MAGGPIRLPIVSKFDDKGIRQAEKSLTNFGKNAGIALGAATAAVGAFGAMSVKAFADFDAEMTKSLAIMGDVSDSLRGEMAQAAREVAKETTFSANQAAESFFFLASAGLDATQSIAALPQVSKFAQAGMFDMALATDLLTDAQSALGLTVDDATANLTNLTRVSDVLVKANTLANASVEQFSTALTTKAGAALRSLGKEVEEGVAVLAAFADQGIKGEVAGTQLSIVLRDLTTKAIDNRREFDRYNVSVFDSAGEMRNMADIVGDLERALDGMSDETAKATLLQMGFSDKSLASLMALMGTSEAIREYEQSLKDAGGTTDEVSGKQLETFNAQLELLKSRFTDVMLSVGEGLTPTLMTFAEEMGPLIDQLAPALIGLFEEMAPVIEELFTQLPGFIEELIPLIPVVGDLATLVLSVAEAIMPVLSGVIEELAPILEGFSEVLAENGELFGALIVAGALFIGILRLMQAALIITGGAGATAAAGTSGFLGILFSGFGVIAAFIAGAVAIGIALFNVDDQVKTSGGVITGLYETWARVTYGIQVATKKMAEGVILFFQGMLNIIVDSINAVGERWSDTFGTGFTKMARVDFSAAIPDIVPLEEYRRELGLIQNEFDNMTFTPKNFTGGPGSFPLGAVDRRFGGRGAQGLDFGTGQAMPQRLFGMAPFSSEGISAQRFQFEQGISGFPGLGTGQPADQRKYEITVNAGMGTDPAQLGDEIYNILLQYDRYAAPVFASARG
jgi:TP901 family phage tail tape measure protein